MHWRLTFFLFVSAQLSEGCLPMVPPEEPVTPAPVPVCPAGWFQFQRATGLWCYIFATPGAGWTTPQAACQANYGANLNGFESAAERTQFIQDMLASNLAPYTFVHIGAMRQCAPCTVNDPFVWLNGVSNDNTFANDYDSLYDLTGDCLSMDLGNNGQYNDITCDAETAYSCGKPAA